MEKELRFMELGLYAYTSHIINSDAFIADTTGWTEIDRGDGDKYHHAQGTYFPKPIFDEYGRCNYRLADGVPEEIPEEDKPGVPEPAPAPPTNAELAAAIAELAEVICGG